MERRSNRIRKMYEGSSVANVSPSNFPELSEEENVAVVFSTPWCPYCKKLEPELIKASDKLKEDGINIIIVHVDCEQHSDVPQKINEKHRPIQVSGYPTVILHKYGKSVKTANGRKKDDIYAEFKSFSETPFD